MVYDGPGSILYNWLAGKPRCLERGGRPKESTDMRTTCHRSICGLLAVSLLGLVAWLAADRWVATATEEAPPQARASAPAPPENYDNLQAVIETDRGQIVIAFFPREAPQHVAHFVQQARKAFYDGTTFHRVTKDVLIQGGDPLSRNPATPRQRLGSGGLDELKPEFNDRVFFRGTVGAVLRPGQPQSGGSQFFICVTDQTQLTGKYTAFGRIVRGIDIVESISAMPAEAGGLTKERVVMKSVTIRPASPSTAEELKQHRVAIETDRGPITIEFLPEAAPRHVAHFLDLAGGGFYDGTVFHLILPGYLLQGGDPMTRGADRQYWGRGWSGEWLAPEPSEISFERGTVGMALMRPDSDPNSGSSQFFICLARALAFDKKYTAFGRVTAGMEILDQISQLQTDENKRPLEPVVLRRFRVMTAAPTPQSAPQHP
jgi:peptidyl-prolyl cis-trans isomerase B (cyclophilin B)